MHYERGVTIEKCVLSKEKNLYSLVTTNNQKDEDGTLATIFHLTQRFLLANFPDSAIDPTATQFSQDIVELRRDWILDDIIMFFKFIRQRQDIEALKTYGSKITAIKLLEFSGIYESERCEAKEKFITDRKFQRIEKPEDKVLLTFGQELAEKLRVTKETERKEKIERAVKTNQFHKDNDFCLNWLKSNNVPEEIGVIWYKIFFMRDK